MPRSSLLSLSVLVTLSAAAPRAHAQGTPIGFAEEFALATDRAKVLEQLIPGTEDYYFYQCLHRLNQGAFVELEPLLKAWIQRYGRTDRVEEIENRSALLQFDRDPAATFAWLRQRLSLRFDAQRQARGSRPELPTRLDQSLIAPATLTARALATHSGSLDGFADSAFDFLAASDLDDDHLLSLLKRLTLPDVPNLPALVVRNLRHPQSRGFGSLTIHKNLLQGQLDELLRLQPALLQHGAFVDAYLRRLLPSPDVQWRRDPGARQSYLDALAAFVQRLTPHNSLKAHVLYRRLEHDLALGVPDKQRFLDYLRLPRRTGWVNPDYLTRVRGAEEVNAAAAFPTELEPIRDDEALVRSYFAHFFRDEDSYQSYAEYVREDWLRRLFAETKILAGAGDMERWYSMLDDPAYYEQLKERVEIAFAPTQRRDFAAGEAVVIDVDTKNVPTLLVKVFQIDAFDYLRATGKPVDASLDLDGMIANEEKTWTWTDNALRRVRRRFELPQLGRPGTYVVELLGNGIASRAVIQKGRLQLVERTGAAGHVFTVLDEAGNVLRDATIWCGGREYAADGRGELSVPFLAKAEQRTLVLRHGALATLERFEQLAEEYQLRAGVFVERETLLPRRTAKILVRPALTINGVPVSLELLEETELTIAARDQDGLGSTKTVRGVKFDAKAESVQEVTVPEGLVSLTVTLRARVRNLSLGKTVDLATTPEPFVLNGIAVTPQTSSLLLGRNAGGWVLDLLGKNGEPKGDVAVRLQLRHRDFNDPVDVSLETDARGRIELGALDGITTVHAEGFPPGIGSWVLRDQGRTWPASLHGVAGETLTVPYEGRAVTTTRAAVALLERRGGAYARDAFEHVAIAGGFVELRGLPAGDYELVLKEAGRRVDVRITAGVVRDGRAIGRDRLLPLTGRSLLHVTSLAVAGSDLEVRLRNAGPGTRVHVFATRYLPPFDPLIRLRTPEAPELGVVTIEHAESTYHAGREIGDEYRYILDRRYAAKFPGNMLRRPGLLLNPWALEESPSAMGGGGAGGGRFGGRGTGRRNLRGGGQTSETALGGPPGTFPDLEFLPEPAGLLANLRPDATGLVRVPLADLGPGQQIHVVALDEQSTVYTSLALPEKPLAPRSRSLAVNLDPARHFTETKQIDFVATDGTATIGDVTTATTETYDSLSAVFRLFQTLSGDADLAQFAFLLRWPQMSAAEKQEAYSRHACHELHFFLHQKDRPFFDQVLRPYLANKAHKTFLDHWLLDDDLTRYLEPWAFERLNVLERILLTRRIEAETAAGARHVHDLFDLVPPDPDQAGRAFAAALKSGALDAGPTPQKSAGEPKPAEGRPAADMPAPVQAPAAPAARERKLAEGERAKDEHEEQEAAEVAGLDAKEEKKADAEQDKAADVERRREQRGLYRAPDATRAWVEHDWWHRRIQEQNADLIRVNAFWRDFADHKGGTPFASPHFVQATRSFAEMMCALAVLDLPFNAGKHTTLRTQNSLTLRAATPLLLVRKEIQEAASGRPQTPILISQDFFRLDDRYRHEGNERRDKFLTDEFLVDVAYGCQVVLTNPTSSPRKLDLLLQIPRGAVPVQRGFYTRGVAVQLEPFATTSIEYAFYFPAPGASPHYPAHVSQAGVLVAFAAPVTLAVVATPSKVDTRSWEHVSQDGTPDEVLAFLAGENLHRVDLSRIAWRLRDRAFFGQVILHLGQRHMYHHDLWSYGLLHQDQPTAREYLRHADSFVGRCGRALESRLLTIDPIERKSYQHVEFEPLFNPRAHRFGKRREIHNRDLASQYGALLQILAYRPTLAAADWLSITYYLLLQDRLEEALATFPRVNAAHLPTRIQYDYLRAYLDFFSADHALARGIAQNYRDHPVPRWQALFRDVLNQLDEVDGKPVALSDADSRTQLQTAAAAAEPALDLAVEARRVTLRHQNLARCELRYYRLDVEFSFSTSPFVQQGTGAFAYVEPNRTDLLTLTPNQTETTFDLPAEFLGSNLLVEARGAGITRRQTYFANALSTQLVEAYGQLKVTHATTGKPLPKVYIKVYARMPGGQIRFHKDGYTDLRGRFDYASVSDPGTTGAERLALLLLSETDGALIREVAPPGK